jgi:hypothetical protein
MKDLRRQSPEMILVICLGLVTFKALRDAYGFEPAGNMEAAINSPFTVHNRRIWFSRPTRELWVKRTGVASGSRRTG